MIVWRRYFSVAFVCVVCLVLLGFFLGMFPASVGKASLASHCAVAQRLYSEQLELKNTYCRPGLDSGRCSIHSSEAARYRGFLELNCQEPGCPSFPYRCHYSERRTVSWIEVCSLGSWGFHESCPGDCLSGRCISSGSLTIASFPLAFISDSQFDSSIIIGTHASDRYAADELARSLAAVSVVRDDAIVSVIDKTRENYILVGTPCSNPSVFSLYSQIGTPESDCLNIHGLGKSQGLISAVQFNGANYIVVTGYDDSAVRLAARVLANYQRYNLSSDKLCITGTGLSDVVIDEGSCPPVASSANTCADSDGRNSFFIKGVVTTSLQNQVSPQYDSCTHVFWDPDRSWWDYRDVDSCAANTNDNPFSAENPNGSKALRCLVQQKKCGSDGAIIGTYEYCPGGCRDGACLSFASSCGNAFKEGAEMCDGADLGANTCSKLGFVAGTLRCTTNCQFDTSSCASQTSSTTISLVPSTANLEINSQFTVDVRLNGVDGISGLELDVGYDSSKVRYDSMTAGSFFEFCPVTPTAQVGIITNMACVATSPKSGSGTVARLTFTSISNGIAGFSVPRFILADSKSEFVPGVTAGTASVTIGSGKQCADSDLGKNYAEPGHLTYLSGSTRIAADDYCDGYDLVEYYCTDSYFGEERHQCAGGCDAGACVDSCLDSDSGKDFHTKGYIIQAGSIYWDECFGNVLNEKYCNPEMPNILSSVSTSCIGGCSDGACIQLS